MPSCGATKSRKESGHLWAMILLLKENPSPEVFEGFSFYFPGQKGHIGTQLQWMLGSERVAFTGEAWRKCKGWDCWVSQQQSPSGLPLPPLPVMAHHTLHVVADLAASTTFHLG